MCGWSLITGLIFGVALDEYNCPPICCHSLRMGLSSLDGVLPLSSMDGRRGGAEENKLISLQVRKHFVHVHNYSLNGNFL